ncbi:vitamin K epoxide reductase family protein [Taibaiella lutea]|uniref:Vitamin K epoxide reductase family protein n=1 Tax=Taibaiella lutea TaxID=2608001 RepID=A0A5M6CH69_9BACT|nr:vitamin K epoxide reductase family protein [Taibaiella lutea]KAA5534578.1 vitamin K epoxide reductase family protein [Taibaiella lutea]
MQPDYPILNKFLGLYRKAINRQDYTRATDDYWNKDALARISFFLFQNNVSNVITNIEVNRLSGSSMAGIAAQTDDQGQTFYYHWENGHRQLLFSLNHTAEGSYEFNTTARFMVYDKDALAAASFISNASTVASSGPKLKYSLITLSILAVILYADIFKSIALPMLLVQISSLLNAAISGIILFKEHNIFNAFTEQFCNSEEYTGCNKLLHSKTSMLFGNLSLATFGTAIYFTIFLYSLLAGSSETYIHWAITLSAVAVIASLLLIIKMIVIRTFCRLCLWIHSINLLSFLGLYLLLSAPSENAFRINYNAVLLWVTCLIITSILLHQAIRFINVFQKEKANGDEIGSLKSALLENVLAKPEDENLQRTNALYQPLSLYFSEENDLELTLVLSTHCHFCAALITTIVQKNLKEKISKLKVYLYTANEDPADVKFIHDLEQAPSDETVMALLIDWYKNDKGHQNEASARAISEKALPAFCLPKQDLPYAELPAVFINDIFIPHIFSAADLEKLLYFFSLPG